MKSIAVIFAATAVAYAAINDPCNVGATPGVCLSTSTCSSGGGTSHSGYCPNNPSSVKCCTKTSCGSGGNCRPSSTCSTGNIASGLCPGPNTFKCCLPSSCVPPDVNTATLSLIKEFEGFAPNIYADPIGLPTVGYGHLCQTTGCTEVPYSFPLSAAQGTALLVSDIKTYKKCVVDYISDSVKLNTNQFGALTSWAFNVGCGNIKSSTLISRLNAGQNPNTVASEELPKWNKAGGSVLAGLTRRRTAEVNLFKTASSVIAHPSCWM